MHLSEVLNLDYPLFAHRSSEEGRDKELLEEHSQLCLSYLDQLIRQKQLEPILQNLWQCYSDEDNSEIQEFCNKMLRYAILFHDTGKINPVYQKQKMKNREEMRKNYPFLSGADHSLLSAVIYLDFSLDLIAKEDFSKHEQQELKGLAFINAYVISRHHSDLSDVKLFADEFAEGGQAEQIVIGFQAAKDPIFKGFLKMTEDTVPLCCRYLKKAMKNSQRKQQICIFTYTRLLYSLLVASDYYATTEYKQGLAVKQFGDLDQAEELKAAFEEAELTKKIREYQKNSYGKTDDFTTVKNINILRSELFLDAEAAWQVKRDSSLFFLEAPTGSGKSNVAMNLSFQMLNDQIRKIFYIYPFNTLVEQNMDTLEKTFDQNEDVLAKIAVVNSVTPIKDSGDAEAWQRFYQAALLDRQFLNYPFVLTTHVSLFQTMFGSKRGDVFGFMQLAGSVIVLDEIQSYKNTLWSEIILFLKAFGELLNIKVIIMSATLPDLSYLTNEAEDVVHLVKNREKYFSNPKFKGRVQVFYELLAEQVTLELLYEHMEKASENPQKILIEFINKKSAYKFYRLVQEKEESDFDVYLITGDDNQAERKKMLRRVSRPSKERILLIATQVVEAGVDIDMDIGYKDISKLDSEEQFMGRIHRSCDENRHGVTYFFDLDAANKIYGIDIRMSPEFTLKSEPMRDILQQKEFSKYYLPILQRLKDQWNDSTEDNGLAYFFGTTVKSLSFPEIEKRMQLIEDQEGKLSVFFNREILLDNGSTLNGSECWNQYKALLEDTEMDYAEKQYKLSHIRSKMSNFIYEVSRSVDFTYNDSSIGQLLYIENGEQYFKDGKLDMDSFKMRGGLFAE